MCIAAVLGEETIYFLGPEIDIMKIDHRQRTTRILPIFIFSLLIILGCAQIVGQQKNNLRELYDLSYFSGVGSDSVKHKLNLFLPNGIDNPPLLLWIHGGAWAFGDRKFETKLARKFAEDGIAVAAISYRLSPATWRNPKFSDGIQHPEHIKDVARSFAWLYANAERFGYDKHSIFVSGYSAGGHLSALLAMTPKYLAEVGRSVRDIKGAIPIAGTYDIVSYYNSHLKHNGKNLAEGHVKGVFGETMGQLKEASPTEYINNQWVPMLVISENESYQYTRLLEKAKKEADYAKMEFYHVKDQDHQGLRTDLSNERSRYRPIIINYIKQHRTDYNFIERDNFKLAYKTFGEGDPLFLLNGGPGFSSHNFEGLAQKIANESGKKVVLFDQRGTGYSEVDRKDSNSINMALMVEDLEVLRNHLGFSEISLMGQSFGGVYALAYTTKYTDNVKKIILSHSGGMDMEFMSDVDVRLRSRLSSEDRSFIDAATEIEDPDLRYMQRAKHLAPGYLFDTSNRNIVFKGLAFNSRFDPEINRLVWQDLNKIGYDVKTALKDFDKPVLVIHGEDDIVNPKHAKIMHSIFSNSRLVILKKCVHYGWLDAPEAYFREVFKFLDTP